MTSTGKAKPTEITRSVATAGSTQATAAQANTHTIGVISDTHGLLREQAAAALRGVECIIHAGDVGTRDVLARLRAIAPVYAVRGNVDRDPWTHELPGTRLVEVGGVLLYVIHSLEDVNLDLAAAGIRAVISGHSHRSALEWKQGVLYMNPGSAGPRRFRLPVSIGRLRVREGTIEPELVELES